MNTVEKINSLIAKANTTTGKSDADLTSSILSLADGFMTEKELISIMDTHAPSAHYLYSNWDSSATDTKEKFKDDLNITYIPGGLDWSKITDGSNMFQNCTNLKYISEDILNSEMKCNDIFNGCTGIEKLENITFTCAGAGGMFGNCTGLKSVKNVTFDCKNIENSIGWIFYGCSELETVDGIQLLSDAEGKGEGPYHTFHNCTKLETVKNITIQNNVSCYYHLFNGCTNLKYFDPLPNGQYFDAWGFHYMLTDCPSLTDEGLESVLQTCLNADISRIASGCASLTYLGISTSDYPVERIEALPSYGAFKQRGWTIIGQVP